MEIKIHKYDAGHMTKMATMPIYGEKPFKNLLGNRQTDFHETWYVASGTPADYILRDFENASTLYFVFPY